MRAPESIAHTFSVQESTAGDLLYGGYYQLAAVSSNWNGAILTVDQLAPDGATWLASTTLLNTHANGVTKDYLPPGKYRMTVGTATPTGPVYAALVRIPFE